MNPITISVTGRLGDDLRSFTTRDGSDGVELRLAIEVPSRDPGGDGVTRWIKVTAFGLLATRTAASVRKRRPGHRPGRRPPRRSGPAGTPGAASPAPSVPVAREIAASMAFDSLRTGYAARKAAQQATANGQANGTPDSERADGRHLSAVPTCCPIPGSGAGRKARPASFRPHSPSPGPVVEGVPNYEHQS